MKLKNVANVSFTLPDTTTRKPNTTKEKEPDIQIDQQGLRITEVKLPLLRVSLLTMIQMRYIVQ